MTETRTFDLGVVLSVTTGRLLTNIGNVYDILNYMTGDSLFTHQLPRASRECAPVILRQHPELADVDASGVNRDNWLEFLDAQVAKFGNEFQIEPVGIFEHRQLDPIQEAEDRVGKDKVIVVTVGEDGDG